MGEVIENKVVQMAFDNTKFEKGIQSTLNLLSRLNNAISGLNSIKYNILGVAEQVKAVTFEPINNQLQISVGKAMALTAALTGVYNITDQIYNTMVRTVRSMTFDQVDLGYSRYEQVVNSTQVLLASAREEGEAVEDTMERVSEIQEKLLWFADETSYDAMSMLDTISKFTSHGFGLQEAATAMEGIANWAATAGVNATSATHAMQQLAQTIGKGYVGSQDWISIQGLNMDTTKFKELVIDAALARGELKKFGNEVRTLDGTMDVTAFNMEKSFSKKWFTKEVLNDVLKKYGEANEIIRKVQKEMGEGTLVSEAIEKVKGDAQYAEYMLSIEAFEMAQVARTWTDALGSVQTAVSTKISGIFKVIFGDYLEAKELWTEVSEKLYSIFVEPLNLVLEAFQKWGDQKNFNGSIRFWKSMQRIYTAIEETVSQLWGAISKIFGQEIRDGIEKTYSITESIYQILEQVTQKVINFSFKFGRFMESIRNNDKLWAGIRSFLRGVKIGFDLISSASSSFLDKVVIPLMGRSEEGIEKLGDFGTSFERLMIDIQNLVNKTDLFNTAFSKVYEVVEKVVDLLFSFADGMNQFFGTLFLMNSDKNGEKGFFNTLADSAEKAEGPLEAIFDVITDGLEDITFAIDAFSPFVAQIGNIVTEITGGIAYAIEALAPSLKTLFDSFAEFISNQSKDFSLTGFFEALSDGILGFVGKVGTKAIDVIIYALSSIRLELIEWKNAFLGEGNLIEILESNITLLAALASVLIALTSIVSGLQEMMSLKWDGIFGKLMWGDSLTDLTDQLYYKALAQTFSAVADGILAIAAALFVISLIDPKRLDDSLMVLREISIIMIVLVAIVEVLSASLENAKIKFTPLGKGLEGFKKGVQEGLGGFMQEGMDMMGFSMKLEAIAKIISSITWGFVKIAAALLILDQIEDPTTAMVILGVMTACMIALLLTCRLIMGDDSNYSSSAFSKVTGGSKLFGLADSKITKKFKVGRDVSGILQAAAALLLITMAMVRMAKALKILGKIPPDDLILAAEVMSMMLVVITVFLALLAVISKLNGDEKNLIQMSRTVSVMGWALLVISGSLIALTKLADMKNMPEAAKWLGICMTAFMAMASLFALLSKALKKDDVANLTVMIGLIAAMTVPLIALSVALGILSNMDANGIDAAAAALVEVMAAMATMLWGMSKVSDPKTLMPIVGSLVLFLISLLAIIPLLDAIGKADWKSLGVLAVLLTAVTAVVAAFVGLSTLITKNPQMPIALVAIAGVILALGLSGLMAAAGIYLIAASFELFTETLDKFSELDGEKIKNNITTMAEALPEVIKIIGEGIKNAFISMFDTNAEVVKRLITNLFDTIFDVLFEMMPRLMEFILKFVPKIILDTITILDTIDEPILNFLNDFGVLLTAKVTEGTLRIIIAIFKGIVDGFIANTPVIIEMLNDLADSIIEHGEDFIEAIKKLAKPLKHLIEELIDPLLEMTEPLEKIFIGMVSFILDLLNDFGVVLTEKVTAGTIRISLAVLSGFIEGLTTGIPEFLDSCAELFIDFCNEMARIIDKNSDPLIDAIDNLMESIGEFVLKLVIHWGEEGSAFYEGGQQIVAGITRGITSKLNVVKKSVFSLGEFVKNGFCEILQIRSPSKVFEKLGEFIPDGLVQGVEKKKEDIYNFFGGFATQVKDSFTKNFGSLLGDTGLGGMLNNLLGSGEFEITPFLNLTGLEGGLQEITNLFGQQQLSGMIGMDGFSLGDISLGNDAVSLNNNLEAMNTKMDKLINIETFNSEKVNDFNVFLEGDAKGIFKTVRKENNKRTRATGYNPLAGART